MLVLLACLPKSGSTYLSTVIANLPGFERASFSAYHGGPGTAVTAIEINRTKPGRWADHGDGGMTIMTIVECGQLADIDIPDTVAIGQAKMLIAHIGRNSLDPAASHRIGAGINQCNFPILGSVPMHMH